MRFRGRSNVRDLRARDVTLGPRRTPIRALRCTPESGGSPGDRTWFFDVGATLKAGLMHPDAQTTGEAVREGRMQACGQPPRPFGSCPTHGAAFGPSPISVAVLWRVFRNGSRNHLAKARAKRVRYVNSRWVLQTAMRHRRPGLIPRRPIVALRCHAAPVAYLSLVSILLQLLDD